MVSWIRKMRSGLEVEYTGLVFTEVIALDTALNEWEQILHIRFKRAHSR